MIHHPHAPSFGKKMIIWSICHNLLAVASPMTSCQKRFQPSKSDTQGELSSHHQAATSYAALRYRPWLSASMVPQRTLFSYWPQWCVIISNNLSEHLIGSASSIKAKHWFLLPDNLIRVAEGEFPDTFKRGPADTLQCKWTGGRYRTNESHQKKFNIK